MRFTLDRYARSSHPLLPTKKRRTPGKPLFRPVIEQLEDRRLLSTLALTSAGRTQGYALSTFATDFPVSGTTGPMGIAFTDTGGVMVADGPGNVRVFPNGASGQSALTVPAAQ